ncbi:hypothetical protein E3N88_37957 [Mikania micrantha]|uniref:Uncharacterized protein n=1 Tax=Mikania micrantha TaxID=192012 RepID=A0A5N6LSX2_9ASTR|nr:hypothetical protein E3N88_37957 [Mikania micrantha]
MGDGRTCAGRCRRAGVDSGGWLPRFHTEWTARIYGAGMAKPRFHSEESKEQQALLRFKHSIIDDYGMLSSWEVGNDCCRWERVGCDDATGTVVSLHLRSSDENYYLVADYSHDISWIFGLSKLEYLDLSGANLSRTQHLDSLRYTIPSLLKLSLSGCELSMANFGSHHVNSSRELASIKHLDLSDNSFTKLPNIFMNMTSLTFLDLSFNELTTMWSSKNLLGMIPYVSELRLSSCEIEKINFSPTNLNSSIHSNIQHLDLSSNQIEGIFPFVLANMSSLLSLDLSGNLLNSSIPVMPSLLKLDISWNKFWEIEDVGIWRQCHIKELIASNNIIEGEVIGPSTNVSKCSQHSMEILILDNNRLNGSIPESFERLVNLRVLDMSYNELTHPIPEAIGKLTSLQALHLIYNKLTGPFPKFHGQLAILELAYNQLSGCIPESLGELTSLEVLAVSSNLLNGTIPNSIGQLTNLHLLDVSDNYLQGIISEDHFANLSMLKHLIADSNNKLVFNISREWIPPFQLKNVRLGSCKIEDGFPQWLRSQRELDEVNLSNASIFGPLPTWLRHMPFIRLLDLSHNKIKGPLMNLPSINKFTTYATTILLLQDNIFSGSIPMWFCNIKGLYVLDLSRNRLSGKIPKCLWNLPFIMKLGSNNLSGVIPSSSGHIDGSLQWLQLNDNNLSGELPQEPGYFVNLQMLDLGDNKFSGNIPEWIGENMTRLRALRLHKNNFTGRIPHSLCKCSYLQILDLAHNNLTGSIPRCFGGLDAMKNLGPSVTTYLFEYGDMMQVLKGFWGIIGALVLKKQWRHKLFMFSEETIDKIYVIVMEWLTSAVAGGGPIGRVRRKMRGCRRLKVAWRLPELSEVRPEMGERGPPAVGDDGSETLKLGEDHYFENQDHNLLAQEYLLGGFYEEYYLVADYSHDISWIFGLSKLEHLDLSGVNLSRTHLDSLRYTIPSLLKLSLTGCGLSLANFGSHNLNSSRELASIKHLDLSHNSFKGQLPNIFMNMTSLTFLDLSDNELTSMWSFKNFLGMIPSVSELRLSSCKIQNINLSPSTLNSSIHSNIQHLDLSYNQIEGIFPYVLANMSSLLCLDLSENVLNSSIPAMPNLLKLDISSNNYRQIEDVGIWRQCHLKELIASYNNIEGEMIGPSTNVSKCSQNALEILHLNNNILNGSISESFERLINLRVLDMSFNELTRPIPKAIGKLISLQELYLSRNNLIGPIPKFHGPLTILHLAYNQLSGCIPESLGNLTTIREIFLNSNRFTSIPLSIGRLSSLRLLAASSNLLNGTIPNSIGKLTNIYLLDVSDNSLQGVVSEDHFSNLSTLKYLIAYSNNKLVFNISREWIPPFQLKNVRLGSCKIEGGFPQWLRTQKELDELDLSNADIFGPLPTWVRHMPIIIFLDLSHNKITGPLMNLPSINKVYLGYVEFHLQDNIIRGLIPKWLCKIKNLEVLDLSRNRLSGEIPKCLWNPPLKVMQLASNSLSGAIPSFFGHVDGSLRWLQLNDNNLSGELPQESGPFVNLVMLDLGENNFSGNIPEWIGENMTTLSALRLHKNNLTGRIPHSLCKCSYLQILDLAHNNLTGSIPRCFGELDYMKNSTFKYNFVIDDYGDMMQVLKGFWGIIGALVLKKQWSQKVFMFSEEAIDKIYVIVMVGVLRMKRFPLGFK